MSGIRALSPPGQVATDVLRGLQANKAMIFASAAARTLAIVAVPAGAGRSDNHQGVRARAQKVGPQANRNPGGLKDWPDGSQIPRPSADTCRKRIAMPDTRRAPPIGQCRLHGRQPTLASASAAKRPMLLRSPSGLASSAVTVSAVQARYPNSRSTSAMTAARPRSTSNGWL